MKKIIIPIVAALVVVAISVGAFFGIKELNKDNKTLVVECGSFYQISEYNDIDNVTYSSDDKGIATVDSDGRIKGIKVGNTTIVIKTKGKKITYNVRVIDKNTLKLNKSEIKDMSLFSTVQLKYKTSLKGYAKWNSSNKNVLKVDKNGLVTAVGVGKATVSVTVDNVTAKCKITVLDKRNIQLNYTEFNELGLNETLALTATLNELSGKVSWQSSDPNIATVDAKGVVTGLTVGSVKITATVDDVKTECNIKVIDKRYIKLNATNFDTLGLNEQFKIDATTEYFTGEITFVSTNPAVATVDATGLVTGLTVGTTDIVATSGEFKSVCKVKVIDKRRVKISNTKIGPLGFDETFRLTASTEYFVGDIQWTSSNPAVASVTADGLVTGHSVGSADIVASSNGFQANCSVTVIDKRELTLSPNKISNFEVGNTYQLTASLNFNNQGNAINWYSLDSNIASVDQNGVVTAVTNGVTTVAADCMGVVGKCMVVVGESIVEIASFTTTYDQSQANRTTNLTLATNFINGTVLQPGDVFSYNKVVGPRTAARGFKEAIIFSNGTQAKGLGGGICQVSSTLFNTVLMANLEIVERHNHSLKVSYVPNGRDATVYYGGQDFRFRNNTPYPVEVVANLGGGKLTVALRSSSYLHVPKVTLNVKNNGGSSYTLKRFADGALNYTTNSKYKN